MGLSASNLVHVPRGYAESAVQDPKGLCPRAFACKYVTNSEVLFANHVPSSMVGTIAGFHLKYADGQTAFT